MKIYQSIPPEGFTKDDVKRGYSFLYMDIECDCGKLQPRAMLKSGRCIKCNKKLLE